jgi:hypothetical protein
MDNSVKWVQTYFERKEINKKYTRQPNYIERQETSNIMTKSLIDANFQVELKGDVTDKLNWILRELNALAPAQRFSPEGQETLVDTAFDSKLGFELRGANSKEELAHGEWHSLGIQTGTEGTISITQFSARRWWQYRVTFLHGWASSPTLSKVVIGFTSQ